MTPRKRLDLLVSAFARLARPSAGLVLAGNDMGVAEALRPLIARLGIGGRTLFTGLLRGRERLEALTDANVLAYPGHHEIFGLVPLEALLCGTPVVVADDSGCGEVIRAIGGGHVVANGDVDALTNALEELLDRPAEARAAAMRARANVERRFAVDGVCAELETVYQAVVDAERPS
jgi:glycosyltransferase involved in cell wall biosynthesis